MVVYEVNVRVAPAIQAAYRAWLSEHVAEMLRLDGFVSASIFTDETGEVDEDGWARIVVHYVLTGRDALDRYLRDDAPRMRTDGTARFGDRFAATRRILALDAVHGREPFGWAKSTGG